LVGANSGDISVDIQIVRSDARGGEYQYLVVGV